MSQYQKKHSPTHHPDHHPIFISFLHLPQSIASSLFKLRAWQSFCTTCFHVLFGLPLGLEPSTSYSIHFFTHFFIAVTTAWLKVLRPIQHFGDVLPSQSPCPLWSTSWSGALHLIFHTFLHPFSIFFSQHMSIASQPILL